MRNRPSLRHSLSTYLSLPGRRLLLAAFLVIATVSAGFAYAQGTTANIGGTITDASGAVIADAAIQLKNIVVGDLRSTQSNSSGVFAFSAIPSGDYVLTIKSSGFRNL